MPSMMENALYIQSGGPTSVINASASGVITGLKQNNNFSGRILAALNGFYGLLHGNLVDVTDMKSKDLELLEKTPSMAFGSTRYEITDKKEFDELFNQINLHKIKYIFLNGGNGTLKFSQILINQIKERSLDVRIIVIPKTVDNDIYGIHHSPGFPSAAKHAIITTMELYHDIQTYESDLIVVAEVMGRNSGWVAAATHLANKYGCGPDYIYVPEKVFKVEEFLENIKKTISEKGKCFIIVSEGVKLSDGSLLFEIDNPHIIDPNKNMGGIQAYMYDLLNENFDCKIRAINYDLMQRSAIHNASSQDLEEAFFLGTKAVELALEGQTEILVASDASNDVEGYKTIKVFDMEFKEKIVKDDYLLQNNQVSDKYYEYIEPLVGEMPRYYKLRKKDSNV